MSPSQKIPEQVEVLIVGYGPVGAAMACMLGRQGVRTLVIDRSPDIHMAPRAIALDNEALRILQMAGLEDNAFDKVVIPYVRMRCPYLGDFSRVNTTGTIDDHPKLVTFYQPDLERALRRTAESHESITACCGLEFVDFIESQAALDVRLRTPDGSRQHRVSARYLVGADGAGSQIRKAIGQEFVGRTYGEDWLIVDASNVPNNIDHVEFLCDHRRPTPHMVAPGGRTRWEFMLNGNETREAMEQDETIHRLLAPWVTPDQFHIERKAVYRFHARSCERYSRGCVFLVGDAAHVTPPFIGQGLVAGLRDAANLSWKLAWVARGAASSAILDSYDQERRPHATKMIALAKQMGQLVMPRNAMVAILIHGLLKLLRLAPPIRRFMEELGVKPKPDFGRGLFVKGRGKLRRGGLFPQMLIPDANGVLTRSDLIIGPHLALIGFGSELDAILSDALRSSWQAQGGHILNWGVSTPELPQSEWCAVVRPDMTIMHDGPANAVNQIVRETLGLLNVQSA